MLNKYLIVINDPVTEPEIEQFIKAISSNYVYMKGGTNVFLILSSDVAETKKSIYEKIAKQINNSIDFIVVQFDNWYGNLPSEVFDWLQEKFPTNNIVREK